jgi:ATP-dependent DNA helicase RecG
VRPADDGSLVPTYAGLLLFGRDPQRFLRAAEIIAVRYRSTTMSDVFEREDLGGTLVNQIRLAEAFIGQHMRRVLRISGMMRSEQPEYPMSVVREAIVNAVAHRDYAVRGEGIRLLLFADRLEIYSPGRLPGHVTLDNLLTERYSRNETIVQVLSDLGYIERLGYGIDRMVRAMTDAGLPAPHFAETTAGFVVTLTAGRNEGTTGASSPAETKVNQVLARVQAGQLVLNARQERALQHLASQGRISNSEFQGLVPDVSAETIRRDLADLVDQGILLKVGEKRATYYILK